MDYRVFLKDYYNQKKEANPAFSLRVFSDKIGFKAKDFISRVMNGEKNLSTQSIPKVASGLRLGKHETEFFISLVEFNQAETSDDRDEAFNKMQAVLKVVRFAEKQHLLGHAQYMVYSHPATCSSEASSACLALTGITPPWQSESTPAFP